MRAAVTVEKPVANLPCWIAAGHWEIILEGRCLQVCRAISCLLLCITGTLGNVQALADGFAEVGFTYSSGAVNGIHIPVLAPALPVIEYVNRKSNSSMVMQALVGHWGHFTNIGVGWSGKGA